MGEVYKAKDTRLDRSVALRVLPAHVSGYPDRRARFAREAKTIGGLSPEQFEAAQTPHLQGVH
jgi:eukaryotic-like serine/threonine-protein kinase